MSIVIDEEFKSLIPPLSDDEFRQLEANCVRDGIRDPLVVWPQNDGNDILVDGHNRFRISAMHSGIRFDIKRMGFKSRDEVKQWIILNQFGRRNLSAYDRSVLALKLKPIIAEKAKERMINAPQKKAEREKEINEIWQRHDFDTARVLVAEKRQQFGREDRPAKMANEKCIYFARFGDNQLKIGSSVYPEVRVKQLSVSCPGIKLVEAIHYGAGAERHENAIKRKFGQYRIGNECYQCSDEVLAEMIAFTKKEAARKSNTDYELAKAAGVSHDTIHKVEVIEEKATPAIKEDVKSGDLSINKAYQIVTGTVSKSPKKAMDEFVQSRREAHEEYKRQKEGAVVGLRDAAEDRRNMEVLTNDFHRKFLRISRPVFDIYFEMQNAEGIDDVLRALTPKQRNEMRQTLKHTTAQLALIERRLIESESNLSGSDRAGRTH